jgi:HEAT repeat protein
VEPVPARRPEPAAAAAPEPPPEPQRAAAAPPAGPKAPARPVAPARTPPPVATPPDPASLAGLADRALEADPEAAAAAVAALGNRRRDPAIRQAAEKLRRALLSGLSARASRAARALGALRDADGIPLLIQVLETSEPDTARAAADALAAITLQRLGPDPRRWLAWWKENRGHGRAEWLFSGLTSPDRDVRVAAAVELSHAAPPPVAYTADMPAVEREKAARAWAGWWARSGHVL